LKKRLILLVVCTLAIVSVGGYLYSLYRSAKSTAHDIYAPLETEKSPLRTEAVSIQQKDPISVLLMGVDEGSNDRGRTDSLIVMSINPDKKSTLMLSIPRDTRTEMVGMGIKDKINHAYAFGDIQMTVDTVEKFLNTPIDYYVKLFVCR
jgi:anionic cell wall polymer biosynthesis LytR-Cps2A-Psr (LCP) family protein